MRHERLLLCALGACVAALVALAPTPSLAGGRGLRASHAAHGGRGHFSHGVEVLKGCGFDGAGPGRLGPRPVAHRPLRGVPDVPRGDGFHERPLVIWVDDGPEVVIDQPGVVIVIE